MLLNIEEAVMRFGRMEGLPGVLRAAVPAAVCLALFVAGCGQRKPEAPQVTTYSAAEEKDPASGVTVLVLRREGAHPLAARIVPGAGSNLISLVCEGRELLYGPDSLAGFDGVGRGIPILYPTPCRVPKGRFTYGGRTYDFGVNRDDTFIHGLVRTAPWSYDPPAADSTGARVTTWIDFSPGSEIHRKFGFDHRLSLTYSLDGRGIKIAYVVQNRDNLELPYGFGLHPYWNYAGGKDEVYLSVPAAGYMEMKDLIPTGKIGKLDGSPRDLRQPVRAAGLTLDDVYTGMRTDRPATIEFRQAGIRLTLLASPDFTHAIVYDLPQNPFFCVENLTCSPDAHNLYASGFVKESHLLAVPPGGEARGWVEYLIEPLSR
jgi:aldose 1-epimerase